MAGELPAKMPFAASTAGTANDRVPAWPSLPASPPPPRSALWDRLQRGEALLLKRLKAWLDAAPSGGRARGWRGAAGPGQRVRSSAAGSARTFAHGPQPATRSPPLPAADSWRFRAFAAAATGPLLRPTLLRFYAHATEHTRRLLGVRANAKFASAAAGPDSGDLHASGAGAGMDGLRGVRACLPACLPGCLPARGRAC